MSLHAVVRAQLGALGLDADLHVAPGETVALLGPNGAGKTSILRVLAGLAPNDGSIIVDGRRWDALPAEERSVGFAFQDHLLFPHLSVLDNIAYGLRPGRNKAAARERARDWLERVGLGDLASHRPATLSGGQQQRVALARALAVEPRVLLLDEPLAALDVTTRGQIRHELREHLDRFEGMALLVTHDPVDAMALADRVVIIESGRAVQEGTALDVTARPRSAFAADVAGLNLFRGLGEGPAVRVDGGFELVVRDSHEGEVFAAFHPRTVSLHAARPEGSARNVWEATVEDVDLRAGAVRVSAAVGGARIVAEVTLAAYDELRLAVEAPVWLSVKATEVDVYPA
jgi:molybdate transport system ATP-binding protein